MKTKLSKKIVAISICVLMILSLTPPVSIATGSVSEDVRIATLSDIRYYPDSLAGDKGEAYYTYTEGSGIISDDQESIIDATFAGLQYEALHNGLKYVVICGDITVGGEYLAAEAFADKLKAFSEESGLRIFVINGDRDINNPNASEFSSNLRTETKGISQSDFCELFNEFGFVDAYHTFKPLGNGTQGALTYSVKLDEGYRLIFADCGICTKDCTLTHEDKCETTGAFSDEQFEWILAEAADAKTNGETPLLFSHWSVSAMNDVHEYIFSDHLMENSYKVSEMLADAGVICAFGGHVNASDAALCHSDSGAPIYSVITPSVTQYPFAYRITDFDFGNDGTAYISFEQHDCDEIIDVISPSGISYPAPYRKIGFGKQFGHNADAAEYFTMIAKYKLSEMIRDIRELGSVMSYIEKAADISIKDAVNSFIGDGLRLGSKILLSSANILSFIDDLDKQLMDNYVYNPSALYALVEKAARNIAAVKVSEVPCSAHITEYGFGDSKKGGTLGELVLDILATVKFGNESFKNDAFMTDVLKACRQPEFTDIIINALKEYVINDILVDEILANTEFRINSFFVDHAVSVSGYIQIFSSFVIAVAASKIFSGGATDESWDRIADILTGDKTASVEDVISVILGTGNGQLGQDASEFVDSITDLIFGEEQKTAMAYQTGVLLDSVCNDTDADFGNTVFYGGNEKISPSEADMRIPSMVQLAVNGNNSFTVTWFTKYSVTGTDIEIVKSGNKFTGIPTKSSAIAYDTSNVTFDSYGFDCGTFGFMLYSRDIVKHVITVRNLVADTDFSFRIGDADKNFWKECSFSSASENRPFTFVNITDTDGLTKDDYTALNGVLNAAKNEFGDIAFIAHSGNLVRNPKNDMEWKWALDENSDILTDIPFMYASGTNDANRLYSVSKHFTYSKTPSQYDEDGTYYSFDYGNAHFSVINTNALASNGTLASSQEKWLQNDLASSKASWKILLLYTPVFGVSDVKPQLLTQILSQVSTYKVDLVLQGGTGAYVRSDLLVNGAANGAYDTVDIVVDGRKYPMYRENGGFVAMSAGTCGGNGGNSIVADALIEKNIKCDRPVFSALTVDGENLCVASYTVGDDGVLTLIDSYGLQKETVSFYLGDVDFDGAVTSADARLALRIAVGLENVTPLTKAAADTDGDIRIMPADARTILRMSVGLEENNRVYVTKFKYEIPAYKDA